MTMIEFYDADFAGAMLAGIVLNAITWFMVLRQG